MALMRDYVMRYVLAGLAVAFTLGGATFADTLSRNVRQLGMSGTIGSYPIAMVATLENDTRLLDIHYSYALQKKKIPLVARIEGSNVTLSEPGGGVFALHFVSSDRHAPTPLTFYTSTGLVGTWTSGRRHLPVVLSFEMSRNDLADCIFYPPPAAPQGPHFPDRGCEHSPDKAALDTCIGQPFSSDQAASNCIAIAIQTCRPDQQNINACATNLVSYLDQIIDQRLGDGKRAPLNGQTYRRWDEKVAASCKATSGFGPDGSGYGADIALCTAGEQLRLLQKGLEPTAKPIRSQSPRH